MPPLGFGNVGSWNVNSFNTTITANKTDDEASKINKWLSPLEPQRRHQSVQANRMEGVGRWFLKLNEFREWSEGKGVPKRTCLFCYGDPGAGKTYIRSVRELVRISRYH